MAEKIVWLTEEGLQQKQAELEYLKGEKRMEVAERLKAAIALGDLSENSEYDDAKNEQAFLEGKIKELEESLRNSKIITKDNHADVITIGSLVTLLDVEFDETETYRIVGSTEADPDNNKISNESPVGMAVLGRKVGDTVAVTVGDNVIEYKIMNLEY